LLRKERDIISYFKIFEQLFLVKIENNFFHSFFKNAWIFQKRLYLCATAKAVRLSKICKQKKLSKMLAYIKNSRIFAAFNLFIIIIITTL
jgi:hypothetical protein